MKVDWFQRGRDAQSQGFPCFIKDARISSRDRAAWYAGWNHQKSANTLANIPKQDRENLAAWVGQLREQIKSMP